MLLVVVVLWAATVIAVRWVRNRAIDDSVIEVRFTNLQGIVASHRLLFKKAVDEYTPKVMAELTI